MIQTSVFTGFCPGGQFLFAGGLLNTDKETWIRFRSPFSVPVLYKISYCRKFVK